MAIVKDFITVGLLREVVKFQKNIATDSDSGGELDAAVWTDTLTTRGKLRKKSGSRGLEGGALLFDSSYELITRCFAALTAELTGPYAVRILCNNKEFVIDGYTVYEERFNYYVFKLNEQSPA